MKLNSTAAAALSVATTSATMVSCRINGVQNTVVDLETGICEFKIPSTIPVSFEFESVDQYKVDAYYTQVASTKLFNDIAKAGRTISVSAKAMYAFNEFPLYHIHTGDELMPNSTQALHARFNRKFLVKGDVLSDLLEKIKSMTGEAVPKFFLSVSKPDAPSYDTTNLSVSSDISGNPDMSTSSTTPRISVSSDISGTVTNTETTILTITSCSDDKCSETTVPATMCPTTAIVDGSTTIYTTWCPLTDTESSTTTTPVASTFITVTSCSDNKCTAQTVPATIGPTTTTSNGVTTVTTWCPLTDADTSTMTPVATTFITVTSCLDDNCNEKTVPATIGATTTTSNGVTTVYTTWCPMTSVVTSSVSTTSIMVIYCVENKCSEQSVPPTMGVTTDTSSGELTVYTTWSPNSSIPTDSVPTTILIATHCADNKCSEKTVPATTTSNGKTTVDTTLRPVTAPATSSVSTTNLIVTHCVDNKCSEKSVPATMGPTTAISNGETTVYWPWCPITSSEIQSVPTVFTPVISEYTGTTMSSSSMVDSPSSSTSHTLLVSIGYNAADKVAASLVMLALSLAYIL